MLTRKVLTITTLTALALVAFAGTAAAQTQVEMHAWTFFDPPVKDVEELPENGRKDFPMKIAMKITGQNGQQAQFVCANPQTIVVEIVAPPNFPAWAGMSLVQDSDRQVRFTVPQGPQQTNWEPDPEDGPVFNAVWDTENAQVNHTHRYEVPVDRVIVEGNQADSCFPSLSNAASTASKRSAQINITYPYYPPDEGEQVPCDQDPEQPRCLANTTDAGGGESPGIDLFALVGAVGAAAYVMRRRRD